MNKRLRVVQIGCGKMGARWVKYASSRPEMDIVGLVDINIAAAEAMASEYGLDAACFTDLEEAIRATDANLVLDVTIPEAHKDVVMKATALGCDVLGEKPMAATMADAVEVAAVVESRGRRYSVMQNRRFTKHIREARSMVEGGAIGRPAFTVANFFLGPHFGGFRELMASPLLLDMAIHTFDQARYLLQADPVSVYCHEFNPAHSWYEGNAAAVCIFEMSDGSVFSYNGAWCAEGAPTSWHADWRIVGSQGTLVWDGTNAPYCGVVDTSREGEYMREAARVEPPKLWAGPEGHDACFAEMIAALTEGRKAETDSSDNLKSMAMVFGAIESARQGAKVAIGPLLGK